MRLLFILVSSNKHLCSSLLKMEHKLKGLIEALDSVPLQVEFKSKVVDKKPDIYVGELTKYLSELDLETYDGVLLLTESPEVTRGIERAFFTGQLEGDNYYLNAESLLEKSCLRLVRNFLYLYRQKEDFLTYQMLCLPVRNFYSQKRVNLFSAINGYSLDKEFSTKLDSALSQLKKTRRPRRANKTTQERYLIDEKKILFSLGKEHHARFETKIPPHKASCRLNGTWRFGFKITAQQHYNAFSETGIFSNEVWKNCHDEKIALKGRSHVNIFANDFIC